MTLRTAESVSSGPFACESFTAPDIAVDLGTAYLRACSTASSEILERPSWVDDSAGVRCHPLRGGAIVDADAATRLLTIVLRRLRTWHARRPNVLATVPTDVSADEKADVIESLIRAGAGMVAIVPEPVAAAVGASLGDGVRMLIDIGEGVTDIAVLERGILGYRASIRLGCADMRDGATASVAAANAATDTIAAFAKYAYEELDRATRARVRSHGICITGGGALMSGIGPAVAAQLDAGVFRPAEPLRSVIAGARKLIDGDARHVWSGFPVS